MPKTAQQGEPQVSSAVSCTVVNTQPTTHHACRHLKMQQFTVQTAPRGVSVMSCPSDRHLAFGRLVILVLPVVGMLPLLASPTALDATTTSGPGELARCVPTCCLVSQLEDSCKQHFI